MLSAMMVRKGRAGRTAWTAETPTVRDHRSNSANTAHRHCAKQCSQDSNNRSVGLCVFLALHAAGTRREAGRGGLANCSLSGSLQAPGNKVCICSMRERKTRGSSSYSGTVGTGFSFFFLLHPPLHTHARARAFPKLRATSLRTNHVGKNRS